MGLASPSDATRAFGMASVAMGAATVLLGRRAVDELDGADAVGPVAWIVRLLGARQFAQGALVTTVPDPAMAMLGAGVDVTHAASMVVLAAVSSRYRRSALLSGGLAAAAAGTGAVLALRQRRDPR